MTMRNLGLSIYPSHSNFEDDERYLKLDAKYGFKLIFIDLWYNKFKRFNKGGP